jgi:hypothetical protein
MVDNNNPNGEKTKNLMDLITPETDYDKLVGLVDQFLTEEDKRLLGEGETATQKVADSLAYLGPFAPEPATFNKEAFISVAAFGLPSVEQDKLWEIAKKLGILKDESKTGSGRVSVSSQFVEMAKKQFFTE